MNVWILQTGEPLHYDFGNPRPMRAMNLANTLIKKGHNVTLWSTDFNHQQKINRFGGYREVRMSKLLKIKLIPSPGYERNISLARLWDHFVLGRNLSLLLQSEKEFPDVAFIGYPPIETALVMVSWLKKHNIPAMLDVKDQWPSMFVELAPKILRPVFALLLFPYFYYSKKTLKNATAFSSMSKTFLEWISKNSGRPLSKKDIVFPLVAPHTKSKSYELVQAKKWLNSCGIDFSHNRRFCFIGSLSPAFDFNMIRDVATKFMNEKIKCQFVLCGDGNSADEIRNMMAGLNNVVFTGWIDKPGIEALLARSLGSLAPYKNIANFTANIPNKIIDTLSYGIPIITSLDGEVKKIIKHKKVGFHVKSSSELEFVILTLLSDRAVFKSIAKNAKKLYLSEYLFEKVYDLAISKLLKMSVKR